MNVRHSIDHRETVVKVVGHQFKIDEKITDIEDYIKTAEIFDQEECVGLIELNISCPNVHAGGAALPGPAPQSDHMW